MLNSPLLQPGAYEPTTDDVDAVVRAGPKGAIAVAGIATLIVLRSGLPSISSCSCLAGCPHDRNSFPCARDSPTTASAVAARVEGRWATFCDRHSRVHWLAWLLMPVSGMRRCRSMRPRPSIPRRCISAASSSRAISAARSEPDGSVTVRIVGQQYSFTPQCILVPANTPIVFRATSADAIHGFLIEGSNINSMLIPGYISSLPARFDQPGEHLMPCQEFCGVGHQAMWAIGAGDRQS